MTRSDLHQYQLRAIDFICSKRRCALFLDMGLGKTATTLTALSDLIDAHIIKRVLVIAPLRVANSVWQQEAAKWDHLSHLRLSVATGSDEDRRTALNTPADIYIINRENTHWLIDACKGKWPYDALIIEESSSFKTPSSKRFKALKRVSHIPEIVVLLSGTPSPKSIMDLWSQIFLIDKGEALGRTITSFRQRFFVQDYFGHNWEPKPNAQKTIQDLIKPRVLSMQAQDYIEVPPVINITESITLAPEVMEQYKTFESELFLSFDGVELEALNAAVLANKLLQFSSGAMYVDDLDSCRNGGRSWTHLHNSKLDALEGIIEAAAGEPVMIAYNFRHDLKRITDRLKCATLLDNNPKTIERWNRGEIEVMLAHPASCGHGLNLQAGGSIIIWFGLTWNLEHYQQMNARLNRQGQTRPVRIIRIVAAGTIEERLIKVLEDKESNQASLLNALR